MMSNRIDEKRREYELKKMQQEEERKSVDEKKQREFEKTLGYRPAGVAPTKKTAETTPLAQQVISKAKNGEAKPKAESKTNQEPVKGRSEDSSKDRVQTKDEKKRDTQKETSKDAVDEKKHGEHAYDLAITEKGKQNQDQDDGSGGGSSDNFFQQSVQIGQTLIAQPKEATAGAPPHIPKEILDGMVNKIYSSINLQGLKELTIEFKDGTLGGGQVQVSSTGGKVFLRFSGLDKNAQYLVKTAREDIGQRLRSKNMILGELTVA